MSGSQPQPIPQPQPQPLLLRVVQWVVVASAGFTGGDLQQSTSNSSFRHFESSTSPIPQDGGGPPLLLPVPTPLLPSAHPYPVALPLLFSPLPPSALLACW